MLKRNSPKETEIRNLLSAKKTADDSWDEAFKSPHLDREKISFSMSLCNTADFSLISRNLRSYLIK